MNTITPKMGNIIESKKMQNIKRHVQNSSQRDTVSFKGAATIARKGKDAIPYITNMMSQNDKNVMKIFSQHYGHVGKELKGKLEHLMNEREIYKKSARFFQENGSLVIKDKGISRSLLENAIFPFTTLPLYGVSWILKKGKALNTSQAPKVLQTIGRKAESLYNKQLVRVPRKLNDLNDKTNRLKGILAKTQTTVESFIKEKGLKEVNAEQLIADISSGKKTPLIDEANAYIKENLYKASNKFFDKHTGNFNTAYERPLNRIVTGLIPVAFLANDAYNLSVLCGDTKDVSKQEAKERKKQEVSRVLTTAFIQLLTFGAFTKQVNTLPWFTPLMSAFTVLFSETTSRYRLGKPIFFLSKDKAKEYNKKELERSKSSDKKVSSKGATPQKAAETKTVQSIDKPKTQNRITNDKLQNLLNPNDIATSSVFTSFKANNANNKEDKKVEEKKERKALINPETFKKGVAILIAGGFALSFLKNSSYTKNSKIMTAIKDFGKNIKKKIYDPLSFKKFEMKTSDFDDVMGILDDIGCKEIADGHRFIKDKYALKTTAEKTGSILMEKASISSTGIKQAIGEIEAQLTDIDSKDVETIKNAIKIAINKEGTSLAEMKYENVARKALNIAKKKGANISDDAVEGLRQTIENAIANNTSKNCINMETKLKPFVEIVIQPFKFIISAATLPFRLTKSAVQLLVSPIEKKAQKALVGDAQLNNVEKAIHKVVTEVFGEKQAKSGKISQTIFANAMEQLQKQTEPYRKAVAALQSAKDLGVKPAEVQKLEEKVKIEAKKLKKYVNVAVEKSFDGVTQSNNKNTDLAMMTKLASSAVTSAFLVADNYNMVMIKSDGEDVSGAKEKANERIVQRLSALFYQSMLINWFNSTFRATYNSSLKGMTAVAIPNTLTTEILTRKSIGMPIGKKTYEEIQANEEKNENRKGFLGKYFKFMRLLTGKKPLKDRMPVNKNNTNTQNTISSPAKITNPNTTNLLEMFANK